MPRVSSAQLAIATLQAGAFELLASGMGNTPANANPYNGTTPPAANMTGAKWNNAYLAKADFSDAVLWSTEWTQAVLVGVSFVGADLSKNATAGEITDLSSAYLQGAVFTDAPVTDADFTNSYWDASANGGALVFALQSGNVEFTGHWGSTPECVEATYPTSNFPSPTLPNTSASNTCPNGDPGPSDDADSQTPLTPMGAATPAAAYTPPPWQGDCASADIFWVVAIDLVGVLCHPLRAASTLAALDQSEITQRPDARSRTHAVLIGSNRAAVCRRACKPVP